MLVSYNGGAQVMIEVKMDTSIFIVHGATMLQSHSLSHSPTICRNTFQITPVDPNFPTI